MKFKKIKSTVLTMDLIFIKTKRKLINNNYLYTEGRVAQLAEAGL